MESVAFKHLTKQGTYLCFEVAIPNRIRGAACGIVKERVDLLQYTTKGEWTFYEIKVTKSDFYSKCKLSFKGHLNYFILPNELYEQVKQDIPSRIGVYTASQRGMYCVKKAKRKELEVDHGEMLFNLMQALSREYRKYRATKEA